MICRPTVLPIVRAALFTIACTTVSPRRPLPDPSTDPAAASRLPSQPDPEAAGAPATPPPGATPEAKTFPFNFS